MRFESRSMRPIARRVCRRCAAIAAALVVAATPACNEGQGPEGLGSMTAFVVDDSPGAAPQTTSGALGHSGALTGSASIAIFSEATGWVSLGSPSAVNLAMQSSEQGQIATAVQVPLGTYTRVRFELTSAQALITAGSDLGGGPLVADVPVGVGGGDLSVTVEKTIAPVTVQAFTSWTVRVDMNSDLWIDEAAVAAQSVTDAAIESATTLTLM